MKSNQLKWTIVFFLVLGLSEPVLVRAQKGGQAGGGVNSVAVQTDGRRALPVEKRNVRSHMDFLASDALQGRGSGTQFELIAGQYLASQMEQFGIEPAGDALPSGGKSYIQTVKIVENSFAELPKLTFNSGDAAVSFEHGREMLVFRLFSEKTAGPLQRIGPDGKIEKGAVVFFRAKEGGEVSRSDLGRLMESGASAVIIEETPQWRAGWERAAARKVSFTTISGSGENSRGALVIISKEAAETLDRTDEGTRIEIGGKLDEPAIRHTWNAVGMLPGSDPRRASEVILLSAHMDHLGVRGEGVDKIFNGADDDASGCVAVLELARSLAAGAERPKRTVYFAFFGSEEAGGFGARYFIDNLPFSKEKLIANLQFEMIGRPDAKVGKDELWLTGFELSNLGEELAKNGAKLVQDPHPEQNFFRRSDNYTLARQGVVAHTVSSFGLHKDYHQASDEIETIDFDFMTRAINSMVEPVRWLVNSDFKPAWYEGKRP
ncbi:MAG: M20/M25/M40 family metallo-hydrolase [Pyrinomonadaceae bacterium]